MEIRDLQKNWDAIGRSDPLWAILTAPEKRGGLWEMGEFLETGRRDIGAIMRRLVALGFPILHGRALDFGCGVGRLTQALCDHFDECVGIDIAPSMIEQARRLNRFGERCRYFVNDSDDLALFADDSFDFVYSILVLQHMAPVYAIRYIGEFIRIVRPGGLIVFQLPSELTAPHPPGVTAIYGRLPEGAYRARIEPDAGERRAEAGSRAIVRATVTNTSAVAWPAAAVDGRYAILLGNHWLDAAGRAVIGDDGRARLPHDLAPGESVALALEVNLPPQAGRYFLELDMVQEVSAWFGSKGSPTARIEFEALPPAAGAAAPEPQAVWTEPLLEMRCVHRIEVLRTIREAGGKVVDVWEDGSAGEQWQSFRYAVTK